MSDRNAKADSSGDLHEIKVLQAEIERLEAHVAELQDDLSDCRWKMKSKR